MNRLSLSFYLFFLCIIFGASLSYAERVVKVLIAQGKSVHFGCIDYEVRVVDRKNEKLLSFKTLPVTSLSLHKRGIQISDRILKGQRFLFVPLYPRYSSLFVNGKTVRGLLEIYVSSEDKTLLLVNHVDEDIYLTSVLSHEVKSSWPKEFLKAQAIISRTYLYKKMQKSKDYRYHVISTTFHQLYGSFVLGFNRIKEAVEQTRSLVMTYKGKIAEVFFHSTCGGYTERPGAVWGQSHEYAQSVSCSHCQGSPYFQWESHLTGEKIARSLKSSSCVESIQIVDKLSSLRNKTLCIQYKDGKTQTMNASHFRIKVNPSLIRSTRFDCVSKEGQFYFKGYGWGHGVGLCQYGAYQLAKQKRYQYREILKYYYPLCRVSLWI